MNEFNEKLTKSNIKDNAIKWTMTLSYKIRRKYQSMEDVITEAEEETIPGRRISEETGKTLSATAETRNLSTDVEESVTDEEHNIIIII